MSKPKSLTILQPAIRAVQEGSDITPPVKPNCHACSFSYVEPDSPYLICGHKDAEAVSGGFGLNIRKQPLDHCPDFSKFVQHPMRNPDGSLLPYQPGRTKRALP